LTRRARLVAAVVLACGCGAPGGRTAAPMPALEARYRVAARGPSGDTATTRLYRSVLSRGLYSRCRMWPSDSRLFDLRAPDCGALWTSVLGAARLLLEVGASPRVLRPVVVDGQVRWFDLPRAGSCAP
jgi:hypothetical protein